MSDTTEKRLKVSREGVVLIKSFEGFRSVAQPRAEGGWIIGYGHTRSAREGLTVSEPDAELLLQYDLLPVVTTLNERAPRWLNQHQFDALASYVLSTGIDGFGGSEVLKRLQDNAPDEAADAMVGWPEIAPADAVVRRRAAERALFVAAADAPVTLAQLMAAPLPPPPYQPPVEAPTEAEPEPEAAQTEAVVTEATDSDPDTPVVDEAVAPADRDSSFGTEAAAPVIEPVENAAPIAEADTPVVVDAESVVGNEPAEAAPAPVEAQEEGVQPASETAPLLGDAVSEVIAAIEAETATSPTEPPAVRETSEATVEQSVADADQRGDPSDVVEPTEPVPEADLAEIAEAEAQPVVAYDAEEAASASEVVEVAGPTPEQAPEPTSAQVADANAEALAASDTDLAAMVTEPADGQPQAPALPSAIDPRLSPYANVVVGPLLGIGGGMSAAQPASTVLAPPLVEPLDVDAVAATPADITVVSEPVVEAEAVAADYAHSAVEDAPGLVLTPPDERDPPIFRPAWADAERNFTSDDQSPLFDEPLQIAPGAILRHEVIAAPRRTDWSETGAFVAMGGIGLVSFGAAMAAFRRAGEQQSGGDQTAVVGWVLALIALICVGVSGYNLFRHWTGERQSN